MTTKRKDPGDKLDYKFDFANTTNGGAEADWLTSGESIASYTITADTGITVVSDSLTDSNKSVTVWLSGGTAGQRYKVVCQITTDSSPTRIKERTLTMWLTNN